MAEQEKFSIARAAASLPTLPPPDPIRGPDLHQAQFGNCTVSLLSDGSMSLPFRALAPAAPQDALATLCGLRAAPELAAGEMSHTLIRTSDDLILIDTGAGLGWQSGTGRLRKHMQLLQIDPNAITKVVLTHLHPDHVWGTLDPAGRLVFPNAIYSVGRAERDFWGAPDLADRLSPIARPAVDGAQSVLRAIGDRLQTVQDGDEIAPGITVLETPGHTPGHISILLNDGDGLIVTGDALVHDIVSFAKPDWAFGFDMDPDTAIRSRRRLLDLATRTGHAMAGYHWNWPGIGYVDQDKDGYRLIRRQ
jgi:glyoxylase-like metal-dependent hydrolase (beta-lactamase superfamily II)